MENNISAVTWLVTNLFAYKEPNPIEIALIKHAQEIERQQQERSYNEEDMKLAFESGHKKGFSGYPNTENFRQPNFEEFIKQFKNK